MSVARHAGWAISPWVTSNDCSGTVQQHHLQGLAGSRATPPCSEQALDHATLSFPQPLPDMPFLVPVLVPASPIGHHWHVHHQAQAQIQHDLHHPVTTRAGRSPQIRTISAGPTPPQ